MPSSKSEIRERLHAKRRSLPDKDELSEQVFENLLLSTSYAQSRLILYYVDVRDEVRTRAALSKSLKTNQRIAVPYCIKTSMGENTLRCVEIETMDDLEVGQYGILEPKLELRTDLSRRIESVDIDLVLVPGVGFDRLGNRLGHGAGYYDHFLSLTNSECLKVGVGFACQLVDQIPTETHDVKMDLIVTENGLLDLR